MRYITLLKLAAWVFVTFFYGEIAEIGPLMPMSYNGRTLAKRHEIYHNRLVTH